MSNMTRKALNSSIADLELMTLSNTTYDVVALATFWIEGVLTPVVSVCGLSGLPLVTTFPHRKQEPQHNINLIKLCFFSCFFLGGGGGVFTGPTAIFWLFRAFCMSPSINVDTYI